MSIISAKDLCLWYGNFQALKNIHIEIPEHSITALIGPSGCGKSTFLKTLNRMNDLIPSVKIAGEVMYNGQNIFETDVNNLRKEVGMVFQKPNPFPMSIYDNIAYGPRTHGITNKAQLDEIEKSTAERCHLGRGEGSAEKECLRHVWRSATAALHRKSAGGRTQGAADGRTYLRP